MKIIRKLARMHIYQKENRLRGRKYITPTDLSANEINYLLQTAIYLKTISILAMHPFANKSITFLLNEPCIRLQTCLHNTSKMLSMSLNTLVDSQWETAENPQDIAKLLSSTTDIIFCYSQRHRKTEQFANGATVPVINISSCRFILLQILSDLLTLQQHFGYLNGLTVAWVGTACPLLNTYLSVAPLLDIKMKFVCRCGGPVSPANLNLLRGQLPQFAEKIKECGSLRDAIEGAQVITTSRHSENNLKLTLSDLNTYADKNWIFLHTLPRSSVEVDNEIFESEKNLLWKSYMNSKWICAAIISRFLNIPSDTFEEGNKCRI